MANRWFNRFRHSFLKKPVDVYLKAAIGASGAPTIDAANSKGVTSITRNSTGNYTIVFNDRYAKLSFVRYAVRLASGAVGPSDMLVRTDGVASSSKNLVVEFIVVAGTATELANGSTLLMKFEFNDSAVA